MIRRAAILLLAGLVLSAEAFAQDFLSKVPEVRDLLTCETLPREEVGHAPGVFGQWSATLFDSPQIVSFVRLRPQVFGLDILCAQGEEADSTSALCKRFGAVAGINGSYFDMKELSPFTYVKDDGLVLGSTSPEETFRTNGFLLSWADWVAIEASDTTCCCADSPWEAIASGPLLMDDGTVITYPAGIPGWDGFYNRRHPRSLIGTDAEGYLWLVVVDGRFPGRAEGMTIAELTSLAALMGLTDALNLDGGGSSTLWVRAAGVLNHPSDNKRFDHFGERVVPNVIAIRK